MKKWYEGLAGVYGLELETVQKPWRILGMDDGQPSPGKRARQCIKQGKEQYLIYNQVPNSAALVKLMN